jgi:hypothetical protein
LTRGKYAPSLDEDLLHRAQLFDKADRDLQSLCNNIGWGESQPLRQGYIFNLVRLIYLNPDKVIRVGGIFDIVSNGKVKLWLP